jgi:hypothetical protein
LLYELGLAIQARRPELILVHDRINKDVAPFSGLEDMERIRFDPKKIDEIATEVQFKLKSLRERALPQAAVSRTPTRRIGLVYEIDTPSDAAASAAVEEAVDAHGLALRRINVNQTHNTLLLQEIDSCDAVILDCRYTPSPAWIAACLLTRPVPTIKLVHLSKDEAIIDVALHPMIVGTKMDAREPVPEHLLFWRFEEDLVDRH